VCLKGGLFMPQRQQMPFNWGPPQRQMGPYQQQMYHPMMNQQMRPTSPMRGMAQRRQMRQMGQMGSMRPTFGKSGGGFLAKIFGKKTPPMAGGFPRMFPTAPGAAASGGSILKNLTNPNAISGFLSNTQQVLSAFQQITPLVSQYGPLVRNIPTMWKLYRGFKDVTNKNEDESNDKASVEIAESVDEVKEESMNESVDESFDESFNDKEPLTSKRKMTSWPEINHRKRNKTVHYMESDDEDWDDEHESESRPEENHPRERRSFPRMYI
jgi:hypothetical protein